MDINLVTFEPVLKALASAGLPTLEQTLTQVVSTAVLGPFGGLVSTAVNPIWSGINHALGLDAATPPDQTAATINAMSPSDAQAKLAAVQEQHAYLLDSYKAQAASDIATMQEQNRTDLTGDAAQDVINAEAAKSSSFFVYGPRPAIMWGLGAVLLLYSLAPLFGWFVDGILSNGHFARAPELPWYVIALIAALLGVIAALRSWDKANGTAGLPPAAPASRKAK